MGIETRNGRTYYYRKRRIGGRVVSEYVGCGLLAECAAGLDAEEQADRQERREKAQAERQRQEELDAQANRACAAVGAAVADALAVAGFHRHKGQWRRRHGQNQF
jgi:hypothetical protein